MNLEFSEDQKFVQESRPGLPREAVRAGRLSEGRRVEVCELGSRPLEGRRGDGVARHGHARELRRRRLGPLGAGGDGRGDRPRAGADPLGGSVYLATEAILRFGSDAQKQQYLPRLASGELIGTFALAEGAGDADAASVAARFTNGTLTGTKLPVFDAGEADLACGRAAAEGPRARARRPRAHTASAQRDRVVRPEPFAGEARASTGRSGGAARLRRPAGAAHAARPADRAAVLMAFEQIGGATRAFEITREFTLAATPSGGRSPRSRRSSTGSPTSTSEIELARSTPTTVRGR